MPDIIRDPYTDFSRCYKRLKSEFEKYKRLIIAVDFDDTIYNTHQHRGWVYTGVAEMLARWQPHADIIVWTASKPERYDFIRSVFAAHSIPIAAINENVEYIEPRGPKIYANIYLDDRTFGLGLALKCLDTLATNLGF